ncbi:MAG TPA: hypothetical protein VJ732_20340 [Bryobacteraceae bacterium]|nr:hypothetical protein [Bryobacteraceae bacterium]
MKISRRDLAATLLTAAALAQTPQAPQPTPQEELETARDELKARIALLARQPVPMTAEPAFAFRA